MDTKNENEYLELIKQRFSENLNYWLKRRGVSRNDLSEKLNVQITTVGDWCNGKKIPRTDTLVDLTDWLSITVDDLVHKPLTTNDQMNKLMFKMKDDKNLFNIVQYLSNLDDKIKIKEFFKMIDTIINFNEANQKRVQEYIRFIRLEELKNKNNKKN